MNGEEFEFTENVPQDMICSICMRVLCQPQLVNCCEQQFCKDCLEKWLLEGNPSCPHCRSTRFSYMYMRQKDRKIGELKVYCPNKQHGCEAVLKYIEYEKHLFIANDEGCPYVKLDCPNSCKIKVFRGKMAEHKQKLCTKRIVICSHCKLKGNYLKMVQEHVDKCPLRPVACPLGCGANVLTKDLQTHKNDCPLERVACTFSELGCETKVYQKDLKEHYESSGVSNHMDMLAKSYGRLRTEHKILRQESAILEVKNATLNCTCIKLQNGHATLQAEYTALQNQLLTLKDSHTSLQREHVALEAEHGLLKTEHTALNAKCTALQEEHELLKISLIRSVEHFKESIGALKTELTSSKSEKVKKPGIEKIFLENLTASDILGLAINDSAIERGEDPLQATSKIDSQQAVSKSSDTSKQDLGSDLFLQLFGQEGGPGYHHIILTGHINLMLKWEVDDLFPDPVNCIKCFRLTLYCIKSNNFQACNVDVRVTSSYGDSGQLAVMCCGKPHTIMWENKPADPSKQLLGILYMHCSKSDQIKVSFSHHQPRHCKCSCHHYPKINFSN